MAKNLSISIKIVVLTTVTLLFSIFGSIISYTSTAKSSLSTDTRAAYWLTFSYRYGGTDVANLPSVQTVQATLGQMVPQLDAYPLEEDYKEGVGYFFGYFSGTDGNGVLYYGSNGTIASPTGNKIISLNTWDISNNTLLSGLYNSGTPGSQPLFTVLDPAYGKQVVPDREHNVADVSLENGMSSGKEAPYRNGYEFQGYFDDGGTQYYDASMTPKVNSFDKITDIPRVIHARWTQAPGIEYKKVYLDQNGGIDGATQVPTVAGQPMPESDTIKAPRKSGYRFLGYFDTIAQTGGKQYYTDKMTSAAIADLEDGATLYARWQREGLTILKLDHNDGKSGYDTIEAEYGKDMPKYITGPTRAGYQFWGYYYDTLNYQDAKDINQYYTADMTSKRPWDKDVAEATLYAIWEPYRYNVYLDRNDGSGDGAILRNVEFDGELPSDLTAPTRNGYTFLGYYNTKDNSGKQYYSSEMKPLSVWDIAGESDLENTLYAVWSNNQYTVTLDKNGGSGSNTSINVKYGLDMPSGLSAPSMDGYVFDGYYDTKDASGKKYYNADMTSARTWDKTDDATLYAVWRVNRFSVTLEVNGGTYDGDTKPKVVQVENGKPMPYTKGPDRKGYSFGGFYDKNPASDGKKYYHSDMTSARNYDLDNDITLYAKWSPIGYYITLDPGFEGGISRRVVAYFDDYMPKFDKIDAPVRLGYDFLGYWLENKQNPDESKQYYDSEMNGLSRWDIPASTKLVARWQEQEIPSPIYTITFEKNGGTGGSNSVLVQDGKFVYGVTAPIKAGYIFLGYFDTMYGDDSDIPYFQPVQDSEYLHATRSWNSESDGTLYARWLKEDSLGGGGGNGGNGNTNNQSTNKDNTGKIIAILAVAVGGVLLISGIAVWIKLRDNRG